MLTLILWQKNRYARLGTAFFFYVYYFRVPTASRGEDDIGGGAGWGRECPDTPWSQTKYNKLFLQVRRQEFRWEKYAGAELTQGRAPLLREQ